MRTACAQPGGLLVDPQSNCSAWKRLYEQRWNADPAFMERNIGVTSLISYLDDAKRNYCGNYGVNSDECSCLSFPTRNKDQCDLNASACINTGGACPGKRFTRYNEAFVFNGKTYEGMFIDVSLPNCVPYACWVDACIQPTSLLTSDLMRVQTSDACLAGICIVVQGTDVVTVPAPASSFTPSSTIIAPCGSGDAAPFPLVVPFIYVTPIDAITSIPIVISNSGTRLLVLRLESSTSTWAIPPSTIYIAPQSASRVVIPINFPVLFDLWKIASAQGKIAMVPTVIGDALPNTLSAPTFNYTYTDGVGGPLQPFTYSLLLNILQPAEAVQKKVIVYETPTWAFITVASCLLFFMLVLVKFLFDRRTLS